MPQSHFWILGLLPVKNLTFFWGSIWSVAIILTHDASWDLSGIKAGLHFFISLEAMMHDYEGLVIIYQVQTSVARVIQIEWGIVRPGINLGSEACRRELVNNQLDLYMHSILILRRPSWRRVCAYLSPILVEEHELSPTLATGGLGLKRNKVIGQSAA